MSAPIGGTICAPTASPRTTPATQQTSLAVRLGGLWLAVTITPASASRARTAKASTGVGRAAGIRTARQLAPSKTAAESWANTSESTCASYQQYAERSHRRRAEWVSPAGRPVRVSSVRLVSFTQRAVAAICYEVEPVDSQARIAVQSELLTNEQLPSADADPRVAAALEDPLSGEYYDATGTAAVLVHTDQAQRAACRRRDGAPHRLPGPGAG